MCRGLCNVQGGCVGYRGPEVRELCKVKGSRGGRGQDVKERRRALLKLPTSA